MTEQAWKGTDQRGVARTGRGPLDDVRAFVASRFSARWRSLRVWLDGDETHVVGEITRDDDGRRTWWADTTAGAAPSRLAEGASSDE